MNYNDLENDIKYLNATKTDMHFGVYVNTVGIQIIKAGEHYPLKDHPSGYFFNVGKGRVLQEFQLLYITKGAGSFTSDRTPKQSLTKGALLCLFPGQWHTYSPSEKIGWNEYYIGFNGPVAELWFRQAGITPDNPVLKIGFNAELVKLFQSAIEVANSGKNAAQQCLSGIVMHILGLICYISSNRIFEEDSISQKIERSKIIMIENLYKNVDVEELAEKLNLSYSWFRKVFKDYTGYAPAKYFQELKIKKLRSCSCAHPIRSKKFPICSTINRPNIFSRSLRKRPVLLLSNIGIIFVVGSWATFGLRGEPPCPICPNLPMILWKKWLPPGKSEGYAPFRRFPLKLLPYDGRSFCFPGFLSGLPSSHGMTSLSF